MSGDDERPPRLALGLLGKGLLGGLLVMLLTAGAVSAAVFLQVDDIVKPIRAHPPVYIPNEPKVIDPPKPGKPQTLLVVGTDKRYGQTNADARSDTMMLIRLNAKAQAISVLNIPRDLVVDIPGYGRTKINAAYSYGGLGLTAETVTQLIGQKISHAIAVDFSGFRKVVDKLGCVYAEVDHRYYHSNAGLPPAAQYSEIDLQPGYQQLCGAKALEFVRYRHGDSDFVRASRQQSFLRDAKDEIGTSKLISQRKALLKIFGDAAQTDDNLHQTKQVVRLLEQGALSAGKPVRQIKFPGTLGLDDNPDGGLGSYVTATPYEVQQTVAKFLGAVRKQAKPKRPAVVREGAARARRGRRTTLADFGLVDATKQGQDLVRPLVQQHSLGFPVYFPAGLTKRSSYVEPTTAPPSPDPRPYTIRDRAGHAHRAYRIVVTEDMQGGQYWGVQGTSWKNPPLLDKGGTTLRLAGRDYHLLYDAQRLRIVWWQTPKATYWVSNTLGLDLTNVEMLGIARSLTRLGAPR